VKKYSVNSFWGRVILHCFDFFLPRIKSKPIPQKIERLLISNIAHLGDLVLATSILEPIKKAYPGIKIGFLVSSFSKQVIEEHPLVDFIHVFDHWKLNRAKIPFWKKVFCYFRTRSLAIKEIKGKHYDVALDLYIYFPNTIFLFWQSRIPIRVGYQSGGAGPLLTHSLPRVDNKRHIVENHFALLEFLGIFSSPQVFPLPIPEEIASLEGLVIFHMGEPGSLKAWKPEYWKTLGRSLKGVQIAFTGQNKEEFEAAAHIVQEIPSALNLCGKLSFLELACLIKKAKLLISVDSVPLHLAASYKTPTIALFSKHSFPDQWRPLNPKAVCLTLPSPSAVYQEAKAFLC